MKDQWTDGVSDPWTVEHITVTTERDVKRYTLHFAASNCYTLHQGEDFFVGVNTIDVAEQMDLEDMGGEYGN